MTHAPTAAVARFARLGPDQRAELLRMVSGAPATASIKRATVPATPQQADLWVLHRLQPGSTAYNVSSVFRLLGALDAGALGRAFDRVVRRHEALRSALCEHNGTPLQRVVPDVPSAPAAERAPGDTVEQRRGAALHIAAGLARTPFDVDRAPLWRWRLVEVDVDEHLLAFVAHHAIVDGWSTGVLLEELRTAYTDGESETPLRVQYADVAVARARQLDRTATALTEYWQEQLSDAPSLTLPLDRPRTAATGDAGAVSVHHLPAETVRTADAVAGTLRVTPFSVYLAAFANFAGVRGGTDDVVIGTVTANREGADEARLIGSFATMLPLRLRVPGDSGFTDVVHGAATTLREAMAHAALPFDRIVKAAAVPRTPLCAPLFDVSFNLQQSPSTLDWPGLRLEPVVAGNDTAMSDMAWDLHLGPNGATLAVEYRTGLFDATTVHRWTAGYADHLAALLANPTWPVGRSRVTCDDEHHALLTDAHGPRHPIRHASVLPMVAAHVTATPDAIAMTTGGRDLTYRDLDRRADRYAQALHAQGVGRGDVVAVRLPRGPDLVAAILGVMRRGAAYLPLALDLPSDRIAAMSDVAGVRVVVASADPGDGRRVVDPAALPPVERPLPTVAPLAGEPAYVLFTSGSTGVPKGVVVSHGSLAAHIETIHRLYRMDAADRMLAYSSCAFDVSVYEVFAPLCAGARLCLTLDDERLDLVRLQSLIVDTGVTVMDLPPVVLAGLDPAACARVRVVATGGESPPPDLVTRWAGGRRLFNAYGPTECTITMMAHECAGRWETVPPIGRPIDNHSAYVEDRDGRPVPYGAPGELLVAGTGVALGYLGDPRRTAERFTPDPYGPPGARRYHTGDLVRRDPDGTIVFLGRIDRQLKVRGVRIEPGDVETALAAHPGVALSHVTDRTDATGRRHLVGYVTASGAAPVDPAALRAFARTRLPGYLVPTRFVVLDAFPLTRNGKIDTVALPDPGTDAGETAAPRTATETLLARDAFAAVLGHPVGALQDFFDLGGSSLDAARLAYLASDGTGIAVTVADIAADPTIAGLAALIDRRRAARLDDDALQRFVEALSDEEVDLMLRGAGFAGALPDAAGGLPDFVGKPAPPT